MPIGKSGHAKALVIIPYFGEFGPWFPLYLHTLGRQRTLDLLLLTDSPALQLPPNAQRVDMNLADVRELAASKLGTAVGLSHVRKLCDLKPTWGLIFEDYTQGYDYWAFGDEDVFYGDLDRLLAPRLDSGADVVVASQTATVGHLTLVRNATRTNELVMSDPDFPKVLASDEHWAYDEWSWARTAGSGSFTKTVTEAEAQGHLNVDWGLPKRGDVPRRGQSYVYDGRAICDSDGNELAYYHWGRFRQKGYRFPSPEQAQSGFAFDRYGFYDHSIHPMRNLVRRTVGSGYEVGAKIRRRLGR